MARRKLEERTVVAIREAAANDVSTRELAVQYDLHQTTIAKIVSGKTYADAGGPITAGRARGRRLPHAKLDEEQVREIREHLTAGVSQLEVARMYGVGRSTIRNIADGSSWAHVE
jgi:transposase